MTAHPDLKTTQNLLDEGYSYNSITTDVRNGQLVSLRRGVYISGEQWKKLYPSDKHRVKAAALGIKGHYIFTHETAALLHELPVLTVPQELQAYTTTGSNSAIKGLRKHRFSEIPPFITRNGLRITPPVRTVIDCVKKLPLKDALCIADGALHRNLNHNQLSEALQSASGRGARQCRRVAYLMSGLAESPGETLTRLELTNAAIDFEEQLWLSTPVGNYRADFAIRGYMILVEFDGDIKYRNDSNAVANERKREKALQNQGWLILRFTWADLHRPSYVATTVRSAMSRARRRPGS